MKNKLNNISLIVLSIIFFVTTTCNEKPTQPPPDINDCEAACQHIGPKIVKYSNGVIEEFPNALECIEGNPIEMSENGCENGINLTSCISCTKFCHDTMDQLVWLKPSCVKNIKTCDEIDKCHH